MEEMNVRITKNPKTGEVFTKNEGLGKDKKQYGYIRYEESSLDESGPVTRVKTISALRTISQDDYNKAKHLFVDGKSVKGRIRIIENTEGGLGFQPKMAGSDKDALQCLTGGKQIFRKTEYDPSGELADELVPHDNGAEISAAAKAKQAAVSLNSK